MLASLLDRSSENGPWVRADVVPSGCSPREGPRAHRLLEPTAGDAPLSDLANPLIIDERGRLIPFAYGMAPRYRIAESLDDLHARVQAFKRDGVAVLRELVTAGLDTLSDDPDACVDWYDHLTSVSHRLLAA